VTTKAFFQEQSGQVVVVQQVVTTTNLLAHKPNGMLPIYSHLPFWNNQVNHSCWTAYMIQNKLLFVQDRDVYSFQQVMSFVGSSSVICGKQQLQQQRPSSSVVYKTVQGYHCHLLLHAVPAKEATGCARRYQDASWSAYVKAERWEIL
jgi:hypothetical protein